MFISIGVGPIDSAAKQAIKRPLLPLNATSYHNAIILKRLTGDPNSLCIDRTWFIFLREKIKTSSFILCRFETNQT